MPFSSRGAQYYGQAHDFLNCLVDHDNVANKLYEDLSKGGESFGQTNCESCGALVIVSLRGLEWETKVFSRPSLKER